MANTYDVGDLVRVTGAWTVGGVATDPTTVALKVRDPSGTVDTYTYALSQVTKSSTGIYYKDLSIDEAGVWRYQWAGTGACVGLEEEWFEVREKRVV